MEALKPKTIDEYISQLPSLAQDYLKQIRHTVKNIIPEAEETISYGMPTFTLNGKYLVHFAAYKKHVGLYPVRVALNELDTAFSQYKTSGKGTIQFPFNKPMPLDLIVKLIEFRVKENVESLK